MEAPAGSFQKILRERLRAVKSLTERRRLTDLVREIGKLPTEMARAALETGANIASISLRASIEFLHAASDAARALETTEALRAWGEMGRRLAMNDVETAISFYATGVEAFHQVPKEARPLILQICTRQMALSTSVALETFKRAPLLARETTDGPWLQSIYEVAFEISKRSAKHSADFLNATPAVAACLNGFTSNEAKQIGRHAASLARNFAVRVGGMAADLWTALPSAAVNLDATRTLILFESVDAFLERGGSAALHVLVAGGTILRIAPENFSRWIDLVWAVAEHGNAALIAFVRASPLFFQTLANECNDHQRLLELTERIIAVTHEVARMDGEAALACFRSSSTALRHVSIAQFEQWARDGLTTAEMHEKRTRRSYYALETRKSNDALRGRGDSSTGHEGLSLERVQHTLRLYVEALTGRAIEIAPLAAVPDESRIGDGRTIYLPAMVAEFNDPELDFRLYKVLAAHAAGQIEFGTYARDATDLRAAYAAFAELYAEGNADAREAFSLNGYINEMAKGERALTPEEEARLMRETAPHNPPPDSDYRAVLALFPQKNLARKIFGTLENGRIDHRLRRMYRGLARDLDFTRAHLRRNRPRIIDLPITLVPFELLFQITLCGGALDDARGFYGQIVSELESVVADYLAGAQATVADTLMATSRVYELFQSIAPDETESSENIAEAAEENEEGAPQTESLSAKEHPTPRPQPLDARELFNAWNKALDMQGDFDELTGAEAWTQAEAPEQKLEAGELAFNYDEWDRELTDHRTAWCRVIEKQVKRGNRAFVTQTRARYKGVISSIRHQFQLLKPENLTRVANEIDGDDYDLNAVIDYVIDRHADGHQSERLYTKRLRRVRDVAVSFLLDQSSSTARTIGRHPLQPYTHPGKRIIEVEKEGLVLMSEALEAVGDVYSINGFTSEGRRNVKFYVIKDFAEHYSEEIEERIGGISYQNNTRLGAAIRHASARLSAQEARTRLLIVLSDGRPYDHDYGDARYAREDTREALRAAKLQNITPFCITIDRESETELRDLYGEIGYTIIDDVLSLPERMPGIYRRLTS